MPPPASEFRIVLLGAGNVGREVASWLSAPDRWGAGRAVPRLELVAVGVRDPARPRGVTLPPSVEVTADLRGAIDRHRPDAVVELLGGVDTAGDVVRHALGSGIAVVTGNKALLARHGGELEALARETGARLRFEAAVGGGIPVLRPLVDDLAANELHAVRGILNGTTNFMLSAMAREGRSYADALADAQARGYAEADPTADVAGHDAASKLVVLARLAFGTWVDLGRVAIAPDAVTGDGAPGITGVTARAITAAATHGLTIKLVAQATRGPDGSVSSSVMPMAVATSSVLGSTHGVTNVVEVDGEPIGRVWFRGPGAGGPATSSAVIADLLALARGSGSTWGASAPATARAEPSLADRDRRGDWLVETPVPSAAEAAQASRSVRAAVGGSYLVRDVALSEVRERLSREMVDRATPIYQVLEGE